LEYLVEEKISRIVNEVRRIVDIDTVILSSKSALRYIFSELWPPTVLDQLGIPIQLLVLDLQSSVMRVYTSAMEYLGVKELVSNAVKSWSIDVVPVSRYLNEVFGIKTVSDLKEHLRKELENSRIVALDELQQNVGQAVRDKDVLVIKRIIEAIRRRKSSEEIERIRRCVEICTVSLKRLVESLNTGLNELSIANMLERYLFEAGAQGVAFATIVAIGKSARDPHHVPRRSIRLERGAPVLIDFGAYVDGYVCDITRMVLPRELDPMYSRVRELCKVIDGAINEALEIIHVGERYSRVDEEARRALNDYTKYFVHGLGHGIGVEVHERPIISPRSEDRVEVGDVVTIEPGIYMEHVGARIEEDVVVGTKGIEVISAGLPRVLEV